MLRERYQENIYCPADMTWRRPSARPERRRAIARLSAAGPSQKLGLQDRVRQVHDRPAVSRPEVARPRQSLAGQVARPRVPGDGRVSADRRAGAARVVRQGVHQQRLRGPVRDRRRRHGSVRHAHHRRHRRVLVRVQVPAPISTWATRATTTRPTARCSSREITSSSQTARSSSPSVNCSCEINAADDAVWQERVEARIDITQFMTQVGVQGFLANNDGILGGFGGINNFYVYRFRDSVRHRLFPWDEDQAFAGLDFSILRKGDRTSCCFNGLARIPNSWTRFSTPPSTPPNVRGRQLARQGDRARRHLDHAGGARRQQQTVHEHRVRE